MTDEQFEYLKNKIEELERGLKYVSLVLGALTMFTASLVYSISNKDIT